MVRHDYAIEIAGTALNTIWPGMRGRFLKFTSGTRRGQNLLIPGRHGELHVPDKKFDASDVLLEIALPADDPDDAAGALSEIAVLLSSQSLVAVQQTDPHKGTIEALVEQMTDPTPTQNRFIYLFGLHLPAGFWRDAAATPITSATPPSVTTGGDRPIDDMILTFAGTGYLEHTDPVLGAVRVTIDSGAGGTTPYTVDVGEGTVTDAASADKGRYLTATHEHWMNWQPDTALTLASSVAVGGSYRNKWA